jgi:lipase
MERAMSESERAEYRLVAVPVPGGDLTAGIWNEGSEPTVLAIHGITASHRAWIAVADRLPGMRIIGPDLRGRGGSRTLPGPFGMARHAADAMALLDAEGIDRAHVVGHSMGAFVAMRLAELYPDRVLSLTLVDGGIPLQLPSDIPFAEVMRQALGPALARLETSYPSREAYREFWRGHPAFANDWNAAVESYVDYDLVGTEPELRSSASGVAVMADAVEQGVGTIAEQPWEIVKSPLTFLRAPRGMMDGPEGLYAEQYVEHWAGSHPNLTVIEVPDVNHYTIVMNDRGANAVAAAVSSQIAVNAQPEGRPE